ncbi:MAG: class I adenylate-forming enzyme family protein [Rhodothermales bacterium]
MQVHHFLIHSANKFPEHTFVRDSAGTFTYRETADLASRISRFLREDLALSPGVRVALLWDNGIQAVASLFGILMAGAVVVPFNTESSGESITYLLKHSESQALLTSGKLFPRITETVGKLPRLQAILTDDFAVNAVKQTEWCGPTVYSWSEIIQSATPQSEPVRTIDIDLAAIIYTSGSTGVPKGVMLSHLNLIANMQSIVEYLHLTDSDSVMVILPLFYIYGLSLLLTHALAGGAVVFDNRFMYPNTVLKHMVESRVTGFAGVPSTFSVLLSRSSVHEMDFPDLRYVTQAGGAMPVAVQKQTAAAFAPAELYVMYGATEAAPRLSYVEPADLPRKWGSIGRPVPNVDLYVADQDGKRLPPGSEGELVARGSNITCGYWKDPSSTAAVLRNGLYYTGDLGKEDEEGFLYVTGRSNDIMKIKGYRVSPREIEEVLAQIDGVEEASVIGVPDQILGEAPVAYVVRDGNQVLSVDDLKRHLGRYLATYKVPTEIHFTSALPKSGAGKVLKTVLREQHATCRRNR